MMASPYNASLAPRVRMEHIADPSALSAAERARVLAAIVHADTLACGKDATQYWNMRPNFFEVSGGIVLAWENDTPIAFFGYQHWDSPHGRIIYLDTMGIVPAYQQKRMGTRLVLRSILPPRLRNPLTPLYLVARTENPVVLDAFVKAFGAPATFPRVSAELSNDATAQAVGRVAAQRLSPNASFNDEAFVIRGAFADMGGFFYEALPEASKRVMDYFARNLHVEQGDALLIVVNWRFSTMARLVARELYRLVRRTFSASWRSHEPHRTA